jgi:hypothetical protein
MFNRSFFSGFFLRYSILFTFLFSHIACKSNEDQMMAKTDYPPGTFGYDVAFLQKYDDVIILKNRNENAQAIVSPKYQGKVFTSTAQGLKGTSFGWINYDLISSGKTMEHINVYGGEDRYWLGPEGGQFSIFFKSGTEMKVENWYTPKEIDSEAFDLVSKGEKAVYLKKEIHLLNYAQTRFDVQLVREIRVFENQEIEKYINMSLHPDLRAVAYESKNSLLNIGHNSWTKQSGTLCIWILGMFTPSSKATVVIPYIQGPEKQLGKIATTDYFGEIPSDRIKINNGILYFKADGKRRSKLGLTSKRAKEFAGSYDPDTGSLTLINYSIPKDATAYINQLWKIQDDPFNGDILNSYNDGPMEDGTQLGPFYELESSSPAAFLKPGESITHYHRTFHFTGNKDQLSKISEQILGADIDIISSAFRTE